MSYVFAISIQTETFVIISKTMASACNSIICVIEGRNSREKNKWSNYMAALSLKEQTINLKSAFSMDDVPKFTGTTKACKEANCHI